MLVFLEEQPGFNSDSNSNLEQIVISLMEKLNDSRQNVITAAQQCLVQLIRSGSLKNVNCLQLVCLTTGLSKTLSSFKCFLGRLRVVGECVENFESLQPQINFVIQNLEHQNNDIRNQSVSIIQKLNQNFG